MDSILEQVYQEVCIPGIAKVVSPRRRKAKIERDRSPGGRSSGRSAGSSRSSKSYSSMEYGSDRKLCTHNDACAWGRLGAALGTGISNIGEVVEAEFHQVAIEAYERRMMQLHGAPF